MEQGVRTRRQTTRDFVVEGLRRKILAGDLAPGVRLVVPEIAHWFDVSQTPAREALQVLESDGLITTSAYKGSRVADLDMDECEQVYLLREALEQFAAREGTLRIDPAGVEELGRLLDEMRAAVRDGHDMERFMRADRAFHRLHYEASGRKHIWDRVIALRYASERYTRLTYQTIPSEMDRVIASHGALLDHIRCGDSEGAARCIAEILHRVPSAVEDLLADRTDAGEPSA